MARFERSVHRLLENPIIHPALDARIGSNINGPSVVRVPDWLPNPLGRYYLYFAHHQGTYIRLAYADSIAGPWTVYSPGVLDLADSFFTEHIASPDVHIDHVNRRMRLYYHGAFLLEPPHQFTRAALSDDGLRFATREEILGTSYWRGFTWRGSYYGLSMPGHFYRSTDPRSGFVQGPTLFSPNMRHAAVHCTGDTLHVYYTDVGDCPERILYTTIALHEEWMQWRTTEPVTVLAPETSYEGVDQPLVPSVRGAEHEPVHQLRDPYLFADDGRTWLFYTVAGEQGIAVAELR